MVFVTMKASPEARMLANLHPNDSYVVIGREPLVVVGCYGADTIHGFVKVNFREECDGSAGTAVGPYRVNSIYVRNENVLLISGNLPDYIRTCMQSILEPSDA